MLRDKKEMDDMEESGRGTDTVMGHLSLGEVVIPRAFLDDPQVLQSVKAIFDSAGANMAEFTVGDKANKINPETEQPEFFRVPGFKNIVRAVAKATTGGGKLAENIIPYGEFIVPAAVTAVAGPAAGGAYVGARNLADTNNLKQSLVKGGITAGTAYAGQALSGAGGGLGSNLADTAVGRAVDSAYQGSALQGLYNSAGNALTLPSSVSGALRDVYTGATGAFDSASSGINDYYQGSALQGAFKSGSDAISSLGLGSNGSAVTPSPAIGGGASSYGGASDSILSTGKDAFGRAVLNGGAGTDALNASTPFANALSPSSTVSAATPYADAVTNPLSNTLTNAASGASPVASNYSYLTPALSAALGYKSNKDAANALLEQQQANAALLDPFAGGFNFTPGDLTQDPGYQFNLDQGMKAQDRANLARGNYFSGAALKEAQTLGQGLADSTYNTAFTRALQGRNAGLTGALARAGINTDIGNIKANQTVNTGNLFSGALGAILPGNTFTNTGALQGGFDIQELLRRNGIGNSLYGR
jgi:hypothetical protein